MSSPTQGMWTCRHNVDGRDFCEACYGPPRKTLFEDLPLDDHRTALMAALASAVAKCRVLQHDAEAGLTVLFGAPAIEQSVLADQREKLYQASIAYRALATELADLRLEP